MYKVINKHSNAIVCQDEAEVLFVGTLEDCEQVRRILTRGLWDMESYNAIEIVEIEATYSTIEDARQDNLKG